MNKIAVRYCGSAGDPSGYGSANRSFITSLYLAGVDVTTEIIRQMTDTHHYGWTWELCRQLEHREIDYKIKIIHLTPDMYPKYMEPGKFHIGHLFWETNKLPKEWIAPCNKMDEIWTATEPQAQMIRDSGVKTPIKCFGQPLDTTFAESSIRPFVIPNFNGVVFYSVFQWILRKNPKALVTSFWKAFQGRTDVCLVLKTYRVNYSESEFKKIQEEILNWKVESGLRNFPKVVIAPTLYNNNDMWRLHKSGDVYVNTSGGEGWGRPAVEAALMGNPIISLDKTGFADIFPKDIYYPISCTPTPATAVHWIPWYDSSMSWLAINEDQLIETLKTIYNDRKDSQEKGKKAQLFVKENLNYYVIGKAMRERLEEISKFL